MSESLSAGSAIQKAVTVLTLSVPAIVNSVVPFIPSTLTFISTILAIVIAIMTIFKLRRDGQLSEELKKNAIQDRRNAEIEGLRLEVLYEAEKKAHGESRRATDQ